jgi:hypothetical protein
MRPVAQAAMKRLERSCTRHPQRSPVLASSGAPFFAYKGPKLVDFNRREVQFLCEDGCQCFSMLARSPQPLANGFIFVARDLFGRP